MRFAGFVGPSYQSASLNVDAQRAMNLYPEKVESTPGKFAYYGTPGLLTLDTIPTAPGRGGLSAGAPLSGAGRIFAVYGSKLYELDASGTPINGLGGNPDRGDVGDDATHTPVNLLANGNQLGVISAGNFYIDNGAGPVPVEYTLGRGVVNTVNSGSTTLVTLVSGDVFGAGMVGGSFVIGGTGYSGGTAYTVDSVTDESHLVLTTHAGTQTGVVYNAPTGDLVTASCGTQLDGYYIIAVPGTPNFAISALRDGTKWSPLDFAVKEGYADNIGWLHADHEQLYIQGESTSEVWSNTGASTFPFERITGAFMHQGTASPATMVSVANGVAWIGGDTRGQGIAWFARGFEPVRISTHAVETAWKSYSSIQDAFAFAYTRDGHQFWMINFPTGNATWVYDCTSQMWHERGWWNGSGFDRHRSSFHMYAFGTHYVGDRTNGKIYSMDEAWHDDAGTAIHRVRTSPHVSDDDSWLFCSKFRLDMENTGALNPKLDWSDDGGHTFVPGTPRTTASQTSGAISVYDFQRLGRFRDRVFRVTITANLAVAISDAHLYFQGTPQDS